MPAPNERSRDHGGTKPHRAVWARLSLPAGITIGQSCVGAMLYRDDRSGTSSTLNLRLISAAVAVR